MLQQAVGSMATYNSVGLVDFRMRHLVKSNDTEHSVESLHTSLSLSLPFSLSLTLSLYLFLSLYVCFCVCGLL